MQPSYPAVFALIPLKFNIYGFTFFQALPSILNCKLSAFVPYFYSSSVRASSSRLCRATCSLLSFTKLHQGHSSLPQPV